MKSPIEVKLRDAIQGTCPKDASLFDYTHWSAADFIEKHRMVLVDADEDTSSNDFGDMSGNSSIDVMLYGNVTALTYRVDMMMAIRVYSGVEFLAIECDGHDNHNVTKQQAAYDRARDRELLAIGVPTIRYTGSEIFHSSTRCANDVWSIARSIRDRSDVTKLAYESGHDAGANLARVYRANAGVFAGTLSELG